MQQPACGRLRSTLVCTGASTVFHVDARFQQLVLLWLCVKRGVERRHFRGHFRPAVAGGVAQSVGVFELRVWDDGRRSNSRNSWQRSIPAW